MDTSLLRLGSCFPTSLTDREAVFTVDFNDCNFRRPRDWYPLVYEPVFSTYGLEELVFHIGLMNADFSGPAESTRFPLGSIIAIKASVEQQTHQPLLLLIDECVAATTPELQPENLKIILRNHARNLNPGKRLQRSGYPFNLLVNRGILLILQVFIHCSLVAWDPNGLGNTKKACNYIKDYGWELIDDPTHSSLCDCCESSCKARKTRDLVAGIHFDTFITGLAVQDSKLFFPQGSMVQYKTWSLVHSLSQIRMSP
uniref:Zona pellucida glycoprotein 3f, tandem duplicate 1 n=1 Tax=Oreochromis niloticus TaxID=8128 RepID=A0A669B2N5_ORENI